MTIASPYLPWSEARKKLAGILMDTWAREGNTSKNLKPGGFYIGAGVLKDAKAILGTWSIPKRCKPKSKRRMILFKKGGRWFTMMTHGALGNFTIHIGRDKYGELVLNLNVFAIKKKQSLHDWGGDILNFTRHYFMLKRPVRIKPSLLARMRNAESFCREKIQYKPASKKK